MEIKLKVRREAKPQDAKEGKPMAVDIDFTAWFLRDDLRRLAEHPENPNWSIVMTHSGENFLCLEPAEEVLRKRNDYGKKSSPKK